MFPNFNYIQKWEYNNIKPFENKINNENNLILIEDDKTPILFRTLELIKKNSNNKKKK